MFFLTASLQHAFESKEAPQKEKITSDANDWKNNEHSKRR
jgi:hypothetical protein